MTDFEMRPLSTAVGAEIRGVDLRQPFDAETTRRLREAFDEWGVLVFRDLDIDEDTQRRLVYLLIDEPVPAPGEQAEKVPMLVSNKVEQGAAPYGRLLFHCDNMWARTPQRAISLYGVSVVPPGAPTMFASMAHGWATLPQDLRDRVDGLEARHGFEGGRYPNRGGDEDVIDSAFDESRSMIRPVRWTHPRTGRPLLYVSQQATIEILGLTAAENEELLAVLFEHLYQPSAVLEHDWRAGDLVVWDNIATQHGRGVVELEGPERTLRKVTGPLSLDPDEVLIPVYSKVADAGS
jgi:alpha-ketoglutarate-dependent taurine dioxygenase